MLLTYLFKDQFIYDIDIDTIMISLRPPPTHQENRLNIC